MLGRAVVAALARAGYSVRAGVREPLSPAQMAACGWPETVAQPVCDVLDGDGLAAACAGVDAVLHLAARMQGTPEQQRAVAVDGSLRLLALLPAGTRVLLASSFSVYDWDRVGATLDEDAPLLDARTMLAQDGYAQAKLLQEQAVRAECARRGLPLTVLRPAAIWSRAQAALHCVGAGAGAATVVVGPGRPLRLTHVDNCADAFVAALAPAAAGCTFNIDDGHAPSAWRYAALAAPGRRLPLPYAVAALLGRAGALAWQLLRPGRAAPGLLVPQRLRARFHPARAGHQALQRTLGWRPPRDFDSVWR